MSSNSAIAPALLGWHARHGRLYLRLERAFQWLVARYTRGLDFVLRHTEGNPFLVMQLLRTMAEEGVFTYVGSAWTWTMRATKSSPLFSKKSASM